MSQTIEEFIHLNGYQSNKDFVLNSFSTNYLDSFQVFSKRLMDITLCSLFFILVGSWLFTLLAIAIGLDSKGQIIFKQLRHGLENRPFYCYKFRTMKFNPTGRFYQAQKDDPRITRVGKFLRITSLDELPQIFNVLLGEMSIVGPRPHALSMNRDLSCKMKRFMCRHMVKPGITGLAQCKGFRGEISDEKDINCRLKYDLFYIKNWSILLDIKIILWTIKCLIFKNNNAY
ncbi:sugar transferase [Marivirga sp.]|uniref:sugar transferase n=1 Tax=Marivirga sp. TaxID=2018662 RepID=UPI0025E8FA88|nr:sugar transferase [Marivirga sp.]